MVMEPSQQTERFVRIMVGGPKLEELEVKNGFYDGYVDDAPRPEELLRAATAPPCGAREDEAEPESSSSSSAGEEVGERTDTYDQAVRAPNPARKLSEEIVDDLGHMAASAEPLSPLGALGEQPLSSAAEPGRNKVLPQVPQPQTLSRILDSNGFYQVIWTVDARKLKSNDKQAVSPPFNLHFNEAYPDVTFKLMIYPKAEQPKTEHASRKSEETLSRGAACFKKSGSGTIQLKCENDLSNSKTSVSFQLTIGNSEMRLPMRPAEGPMSHTFSQSAMAGLPKEVGLDIWNLNEVVDSKSTTFYVYATIRTRSNVDDSISPL